MEPEDIDGILGQLESFLERQDGKSLPNSQRAVLYGLLTQPTLKYEQLATEIETRGLGSYKPKTLKNDASNLFNRLTIVLGLTTKVKKGNVQRIILDWYRRQSQSGNGVQATTVPAATLQPPGNLLALESWQPDLEYLHRRVREGCRVLGITGSPRIGKTYFTYTLCDRLADRFDTPSIWCMASHVPTLEALYQTILRQLGDVPTDSSALTALVELFHSRRLLLVLDGTEAFYQPQQRPGQFERAAANYEVWLKQLLEVPMHQSCLIWVGRELPACFGYARGVLELHRVRPLSERDALHLLEARALAGNTPLDGKDWARLLNFCGGNPTWLLMAVSRIEQLKTTIAAFLSHPVLAEEVVDTLGYTLDRLSPLERTVLIWLLLHPHSPKQSDGFPIPDTTFEEQREALLALQGRGLIRQDSPTGCYHLDPPLLRYVLARRIGIRADAEIAQGTLEELCHYPLLHTLASAHWQHWQRQHLLGAIAQRLQRRYAFREEQRAALQTCLDTLRRQPLQQQGYGTGNVLNLAALLNLPLAALNLNNLPIYHADLRYLSGQQAILSNNTLHHPLLPTHLTGRLTTAMSADGRLIAAGDQDGHFLCWRSQNNLWQLHAVQTLPSGIKTILCPDSNTVVLLLHQAIYSWWMEGEPQPQRLIDLPAPGHCLAQSPLNQIAVGLITGQILLWDGLQASLLEAHQTTVCGLCFSPDGQRLASLDRDNRVLEWHLPTEGNTLPTLRELTTYSFTCLTVSWAQDTLLRAAVNRSRLRLWVGETTVYNQAIADAYITTLQFSANGHYLIGGTDGDRLIHWAWSCADLTTLPLGSEAWTDLAITNDGRWLLVTSTQHLHLIDLDTCECLWQMDGAAAAWTEITFTNIQGLSPVETQLLSSLGLIISETASDAGEAGASGKMAIGKPL